MVRHGACPGCHQLCDRQVLLPPSALLLLPVRAGWEEEGQGGLQLYPLALSRPGKRAVVGYEDGTMRIWDLKQGTSLHVLKGREEFNHLGLSLTGEQPLPVGSDLC